MREIEKMTLLIAKILNLKINKKEKELREEINNGYANLFDIENITIENEKIRSILNSKDLSGLFIKKLEVLIQLMELDYKTNPNCTEKKKVLYALLKKIIEADSKNFSIERLEKLNLYK